MPSYVARLLEAEQPRSLPLSFVCSRGRSGVTLPAHSTALAGAPLRALPLYDTFLTFLPGLGGLRLLSHYLFWIVLLPFARKHEDRDSSLLLHHLDGRGPSEPSIKVGEAGQAKSHVS